MRPPQNFPATSPAKTAAGVRRHMRRWGWARHKGWGKHASLFSLVKQRIGCYNRHRKNVPGGIFPESSVIFIENNRSTGQSRAVISFWLSRECSLLPRRETQSRQSQTFRSPPLGGKTPPFCLRTFHIYYMVHPARKSNILSKSLFGAHTPNRHFI